MLLLFYLTQIVQIEKITDFSSLMMTYANAVNYLLEQLPMFQRIGAAAYRADLGNITALCQILDNPQNHLRCIHIAGTNGKGSVSHFMASALQEEGYKVGLFVSPHYKDYRERIKINGKYISKSFITHFINENLEKFNTVNASFFEITTAMAFAYFKAKKVDFVILETGMGGRLDSTNIITPLLSVITNISFDHVQFLGNSLPTIAAEKGGIIKPNIPIVIGETHRMTKPVFTTIAKQHSSPITFADKATPTPITITKQFSGYQLKNCQTAFTALHQLQALGVAISNKAIKNGFKNVTQNTAFIGRWMVIQKSPTLIFDSAHNQAGLAEIKTLLLRQKYNHLHIVYGTVGDKDITKNLASLPKNATYYFCAAKLPRALPVDLLQQKAKRYKLNGATYPNVKNALQAAQKIAAKGDLILVVGSVFVVAEVL